MSECRKHFWHFSFSEILALYRMDKAFGTKCDKGKHLKKLK